MTNTSRNDLRADCANCFGLCCTALGFARSHDFPVEKAPGDPCANLAVDFTCGIHARLAERGFRGCTVFDCFGAGQLVSQSLFGGVSWRERPESRKPMFDAFHVAMRLQEMRWHLLEARERAYDAEPASRLLAALDPAALDPAAFETLDIGALRVQARAVLMEVSAEIRASYFSELDPRLQPGADLAGVDLRGVDLVAADLRGACLIGADLRGADLTAADLLGADLRGARMERANLAHALYLTPAQVSAGTVDSATRLPAVFAQDSSPTDSPRM